MGKTEANSIFSVRYSLPTSNICSALSGTSSSTNLGFTTAAGFGSFFSPKAFDDDAERQRGEERMSTPDVKSYLRMTDPDDKFPTLMRRDDHSGIVCRPTLLPTSIFSWSRFTNAGISF